MASTEIDTQRLAAADDIAEARWQAAHIRNVVEPSAEDGKILGKQETSPSYVRFVPPYLLDLEPAAPDNSRGEQ